MPLPPLCGPVLYGSTIGIRSTLDSDPRLPPYYISVPGSSHSSATLAPSLPRSAAGQRTPLDDPPPAGDITSASAAVTVASTPSPFASPASQEEREEQAAKHSSRLIPLGCCTDHPYRESSASEFCIISASVSTSMVPVCEYDEVFLINGPSLRDFLHPSQQQPPSSLRRDYSAPVQTQKGDASSTAARRAAAAAADRRTLHLLWVVCCPSKAELHEQQQQHQRQLSHHSPHLRGKEAIILTRKDNEKQQQEPAEDEEPVRLKSVVCADIKQLQQAVDSHCKWRVLRQSGNLVLPHNASHSACMAAVKEGPQRTRATAFDPTAAAEPAVGAPLRWDEEIYFQNVHNGCFLSVRHYKQRAWCSEILALAGAAAAATIKAHRTLSSPSDHAGSAADGALAAQAAGQQARLLPGLAAAAATGGSVSSAVAAGDRDTAAATGAAAATEQKHSSWRLVLAGIAASPWWNRQCACTLMAPTEIDDCLLRRETLNGVSIAAYLQAADPQFPFSSLQGASAVREAAAGGGGAVWWRQQRQALALSPYTSCCKFHSDQNTAAGESGSSACAAAASAEKSRTNVSRSSQQLPLQGGGPACLSESWRQASAFGQQQVGGNEWVVQRLHRDWKFLPREVKERFLLEDLLFCLSGIDGTLVRVFAVQEACCCAAVAAASHQASPSSSCSSSDSSRRGSSSSSGSEQVPCCYPRPKFSSGRTGPPLHCYNSARRVLPQFRSWLHPLLTGASCCGSSEAAAADAGSQQRGSSCRESFQSLYMQRSLGRASAEPLHATGGNDGFFPSSEDYAFCQILPSLMPAACSLRLLLVFLELAGRSQSTRSSSTSSSKVFCRGVRSCCSSSSNGAAPCQQERRPEKGSPEEREALQHASARERPPFSLCDGATADASPSAAAAVRGTRCGTRAVEEEEDEGGGGAVLDALCVALRKVVEEIGMQVGVWEGEVRRGRLTLQGLRAQLGPIARAAAVAEQVARLAFGKRGGSILNAIEEVQKSIPCNDSCQEVCRFLFEKAAAPLVGMVEKWIHRGKVVDPYDEFFIVENTTVAAEGEPVAWRGCSSTTESQQQQLVSSNSADQEQQQQNLMLQNCLDWWEQRFMLVPHRIPYFLKMHARDILHAGMYVYVLKSCKWPLRPSDFHLKKTPLPPQLLLPMLPRACIRASKGLMQLFFSPLQLLRTFELLHAFFLGGRGDFFQCFFDHAAASTPAAAAVAGGAVVPAAAADGPLAAAAKTSAATSLLPPLLLLLRQKNSRDSPLQLNVTYSGSNAKDTLLLQLASLESSMQQAIRSVGAAATQGGTGRFDGLKDKLLFFMHPVASLCEASQLLLRVEEGDNMLRLLGLLLPPAAAEEQQEQQQPAGGAKTAAATRPSFLFHKPTCPSDWHRRLCLRYRCGWPLSLIYSSKALCSYELIFRLLLHLHLAQRQLNHLWAHLHGSRSLFAMKEAPASLRLALATGEEMRFFLRNLLFYASTDVVAHHYGILLLQLGAADSSSDAVAVAPVLSLPAAAAAAASARDSPAAKVLLHASSSSSCSSSVSPRGGCRQRIFFTSVVAAVSSGVPAVAGTPSAAATAAVLAAAPTPTSGGDRGGGVAAATANLQFRDVQRLHTHFLENVLRDLFLKDLPLLQALSKSLTICLVFSRHALKFVLDATQTVEAAAAAAQAAADGLEDESAAADPGSAYNPRGRSKREKNANNTSENSSKPSDSAGTAASSSISVHPSAGPSSSSSSCSSSSWSSCAATGDNRRFAGVSPHKRRNGCCCSRLLLKDQRREHLRSALSTPGFASMTRSACLSFRTYAQEFVTKLQAFSRRDPPSVSEHLLCRLEFNGGFSRPCVWLPNNSSSNSNSNDSSSRSSNSKGSSGAGYSRYDSSSSSGRIGSCTNQRSVTPNSAAVSSSNRCGSMRSSSKPLAETGAAANVAPRRAVAEHRAATFDFAAPAGRGTAAGAEAVREGDRRGEGEGPTAVAATAAGATFLPATGIQADVKQGGRYSFTGKNVPWKSAAASVAVTAAPAIAAASFPEATAAAPEADKETQRQEQSNRTHRLNKGRYLSPSSSTTTPVFDRPPPLAAPLREAAATLERAAEHRSRNSSSSSYDLRTIQFRRPPTSSSLLLKGEKNAAAAILQQHNRNTASGVAAGTAAAAPSVACAAAAPNGSVTSGVSSFSPKGSNSTSVAAAMRHGRTTNEERAGAPAPDAFTPPTPGVDARRIEATKIGRHACTPAHEGTRVYKRREEHEEASGEDEEIEEGKFQEEEETEEGGDIAEEASDDGVDEEEKVLTEEGLNDEEDFEEAEACTGAEGEPHNRRNFFRCFHAAASKAAAGTEEKTGRLGLWQHRLLPHKGPQGNPREKERSTTHNTAAAARRSTAGTAGAAAAADDGDDEEESLGEEEKDEDDGGGMLEKDETEEEESILIYSLQHGEKATHQRGAARKVVELETGGARPTVSEESEEEEEEEEEQEDEQESRSRAAAGVEGGSYAALHLRRQSQKRRAAVASAAGDAKVLDGAARNSRDEEGSICEEEERLWRRNRSHNSSKRGCGERAAAEETGTEEWNQGRSDDEEEEEEAEHLAAGRWGSRRCERVGRRKEAIAAKSCNSRSWAATQYAREMYVHAGTESEEPHEDEEFEEEEEEEEGEECLSHVDEQEDCDPEKDDYVHGVTGSGGNGYHKGALLLRKNTQHVGAAKGGPGRSGSLQQIAAAAAPAARKAVKTSSQTATSKDDEDSQTESLCSRALPRLHAAALPAEAAVGSKPPRERERGGYSTGGQGGHAPAGYRPAAAAAAGGARPGAGASARQYTEAVGDSGRQQTAAAAAKTGYDAAAAAARRSYGEAAAAEAAENSYAAAFLRSRRALGRDFTVTVACSGSADAGGARNL